MECNCLLPGGERRANQVHAEILHVDECPNLEEAGQRFRAAPDASGRSNAEIVYRLLRTSEEASKVPVEVSARGTQKAPSISSC
jgi:hypothetical protein